MAQDVLIDMLEQVGGVILSQGNGKAPLPNHIFEHSEDERLEIVKEMTGGRGADVVIECAGVPSALREAINMVRRIGTVVEIGNYANPGNHIDLDPCRDVVLKHITIQGMTANPPRTFEEGIQILEKYRKIVDLQSLITHRFPIEQALDALNASRDVKNCIKSMIVNEK